MKLDAAILLSFALGATGTTLALAQGGVHTEGRVSAQAAPVASAVGTDKGGTDRDAGTPAPNPPPRPISPDYCPPCGMG